MQITWLLLILAPLSFPAADPVGEIAALVDSGLVQEKKLYWLKCSQALKSKQESRRHALEGVALFLATVPLEYSISRIHHLEKTEAPTPLNGAAFVLMCGSLWHLAVSFHHFQDYQRDRACCRYWQEYTPQPY